MNKLVIDNKKYVASLDVHAQNTFTPLCPDELPVSEGDQIVEGLNEQAKLASKRVGVKEAHNSNATWIARTKEIQLAPVIGENVDVRWVAHSIVGSRGFELIKGLPKITDYDFYMWQGIELDMHPYGVCYHDLAEKLSTGLIEYLRFNNLSTVIVGGLATDYCVKTSVLQLLEAKFKVVVNLAACRGMDKAGVELAKAQVQQAGARLANCADDIVNAT